jgi:DNA-binding CsgD family transcriptional regulator
LARPSLDDPTALAHAARIEGSVLTLEGRVSAAAPLLLSAAVELLATNPQLGRKTLLETLQATILHGNLDPATRVVADEAAAAAARTPASVRTSAADLLLDAFSMQQLAGFAAAAPLLHSTLDAAGSEKTPERLLPWTILLSNAARMLWDPDGEEELMSRVANLSRERGALALLEVALHSRASTEIAAGCFSAAEASLSAASDIGSALGTNVMPTEFLHIELLAARGRESDARALADAVLPFYANIEIGTATHLVHLSLLGLELALGHYADALALAVSIFDCDPIPSGNVVLPAMVEAATFAGDEAAASKAMDRLTERAPASGTAVAMGLLARSQALRAGNDGEVKYREAIELLGSTRMAVEIARSHLLFGEWLRRQRRPRDAREHLRTAHEMLETMGAEAFAKRARDELGATGEHPRKRTFEATNDLTPQEARIAHLATSGETNIEIAAQLYISANTVDYHLRKVYRKLGVSSRRELRPELLNP